MDTETIDIDDLMKTLPSGSGFDCVWEDKGRLKNGKQIIETYFHNLNENGFYDGYTKIRLKLDIENPSDFVMTCLGGQKYIELSRDYWEETIYYHLTKTA